MMTKSSTKDVGLRGVLVADTNISLVEGIKGHLEYRGYDIHDLAKHSTYEEVAFLLLYGSLPNREQLAEFTKRLMDERSIPSELLLLLEKIPKSTPPMAVLQAAVAVLAGFDAEIRLATKNALERHAIELLAKLPSLVAAWDRIRKNLAPIGPDPNLSAAANFLYMLNGRRPDDETARDFEVCLILHSEHSFNASTFAARVVASTRAQIYACVSAAIGALSGELHGGANSQVMRNLQEIGDPARVEEWVKTNFEQGNRIMGMGHPIYKTIDPRAGILRQMSERLGQKTGQAKWYQITRSIEEVTQQEFRKRKGSEIYANVDLYSASVYYMMGIPIDLYTPVFAMARMAGWAAHIMEERFPEPPVKPVLYRPSADYSGHYCGPVGCKYIPLTERKK